MKRIAHIVLVALALTGCKKDKCLKSLGDVVTKERVLINFTEVEVNDNINLVLTQDTVNKVMVEAGENLHDWIETEVKDGRLIVTDYNRCNWLRSFKKEITIHVHLQQLDRLEFNSTGDVSCTNTLLVDFFKFRSLTATGNIQLQLQADSTDFRVETGPVDLLLSGTANYNYLYHSGTGFVWAEDYITNKTHFNHTSSGEFHVRATQQLVAEIRSVGDAYYYGNPTTLESTITGAGDLIAQ